MQEYCVFFEYMYSTGHCYVHIHVYNTIAMCMLYIKLLCKYNWIWQCEYIKSLLDGCVLEIAG